MAAVYGKLVRASTPRPNLMLTGEKQNKTKQNTILFPFYWLRNQGPDKLSDFSPKVSMVISGGA